MHTVGYNPLHCFLVVVAVSNTLLSFSVLFFNYYGFWLKIIVSFLKAYSLYGRENSVNDTKDLSFSGVTNAVLWVTIMNAKLTVLKGLDSFVWDQHLPPHGGGVFGGSQKPPSVAVRIMAGPSVSCGRLLKTSQVKV